MPSRIINLSLNLAIEEIATVLAEYPASPYQTAFSEPRLRQKLVDRILSQFPNYYTILEEGQTPPQNPRALYRSSEEQAYFQDLIRQGIAHLIRENSTERYHSSKIIHKIISYEDG
jgi:hypothetical protein